ncbi:hypothetical protein Acr_00g0031900 [Actinidia rufa]|uniref:Retrovirus-related Pol polyprotein from transposon TNT 1-94-like beta-barrel domain-containing protein n=1 Tax=Actinidia rufa TaxID=165716 RepID=A0A7J0DFG2_9ERIC|nr:hypothetical protein Acr_00g0031900 [Actinidia rufa]
MSLDELLGSLMTHEIMLKGREEEAKPKRSLALKSSHKESEEEEEESDDDKEMALLTKRFKRFMRKEKTFNKKHNMKETPYGEPSKKDPPICFECHKPGHYKSDFPRLKKEGKKFKRKALKVTWDDSEGSESEQEDSENEMANFCLMAKGDEVCLKSYGSSDKWFMDSACSRHMTGDKSKLSSFTPKDGGFVTFGDNSRALYSPAEDLYSFVANSKLESLAFELHSHELADVEPYLKQKKHTEY